MHTISDSNSAVKSKQSQVGVPKKKSIADRIELDDPKLDKQEEKKASGKESKVAQTVDVNKVETKRAKLMRAAFDQGPTARPSKDQQGNNQK